jgi:hypothetical protein
VATNTNLRTLRDLRGCHIQMLTSLYSRTCQRIHEETGVDLDQIMAYVHYPPSVYQLHVHFKHLTAPGGADTLRIHTLQTILNNLHIDPEYYSKSHMQLPVYVHTDLYLALVPNQMELGSNQMELGPNQMEMGPNQMEMGPAQIERVPTQIEFQQSLKIESDSLPEETQEMESMNSKASNSTKITKTRPRPTILTACTSST